MPILPIIWIALGLYAFMGSFRGNPSNCHELCNYVDRMSRDHGAIGAFWGVFVFLLGAFFIVMLGPISLLFAATN